MVVHIKHAIRMQVFSYWKQSKVYSKRHHFIALCFKLLLSVQCTYFKVVSYLEALLKNGTKIWQWIPLKPLKKNKIILQPCYNLELEYISKGSVSCLNGKIVLPSKLLNIPPKEQCCSTGDRLPLT